MPSNDLFEQVIQAGPGMCSDDLLNQVIPTDPGMSSEPGAP